MVEPRVIRLLRTAIGMILGFLLMWAAVAVAYQGLIYGQRPFVFFIALFVAWVRERFSRGKER